MSMRKHDQIDALRASAIYKAMLLTNLITRRMDCTKSITVWKNSMWHQKLQKGCAANDFLTQGDLFHEGYAYTS